MNAAAKEDRLEDLHVLLVDDDAAFLDLLEALLQHLGVKAITRAISGRDAFSKLHHVERVVDCVLCDYSMAEGNGLQLLQAIRTVKIKLSARTPASSWSRLRGITRSSAWRHASMSAATW